MVPWIGEHYINRELEHKILIVGESHYGDENGQNLKFESSEFTRKVIKEMAIGKEPYNTKLFQNLNRALFSTNDINTNKFWNNVVFHNLIQRVISTKKNRPNKEDYSKGWEILFKLIEIVRPSICLFIGTSSANYIMPKIKQTQFEITGVKYTKKISNTYAKYALITDVEKNKIEAHFIRHTSQYFSWGKWNIYLQSTIGQQINWLNEQIK